MRLVNGVMLVLAICTASVVSAGSAADGQIARLSLQECRMLALQNNLSFRASRLAPQLSEARLQSQLAPFDPTFSASVTGAHSQQPNTLVYDATSGSYVARSVPAQNIMNTRLGIGKEFAFGTNASLNLNNSWSKASGSSNYGSSLTLALAQPLLRGFGKDANENGIRIARVDREVSISRLLSDASNTVQQVESAYWDLVNAREIQRVAQLSLEQAQRLLDRSRARAETGSQALRDVIQAEAGVATAFQEIVSAEAGIRAAEDNLKRLTNISGDARGWGISILTTDTTHVAAELPSFDSLVEAALASNPAVYQANKGVETSKFTLQYRFNGLLPTLNASTEIVLRDGDLSLGPSMDDLPTAKYPSWSAGLQLSVPLGNRQSEASYREALVGVRSAELTLEDARQRVYADVRAAVRRVETSRQQIAAAAETRRLREATLENEQERLRLGLSTTYDVLVFEGELANSRRSYLNARVEHEKALLALDIATGQLLRNRNIQIEMDGLTLEGD